MLFDKFVNRIIVKGTLEAIDPIHIGTSEKNSLKPTEVDMSVLKDHLGNPVIPGSSIKGAIRSYFESVMRGIYPNDIENKKVCNVLEDNYSCINQEIIKGLKEKISKEESKIDEVELSKKIYEKSCDVCKLFGNKSIAGKLQFKDCMFKGDKPIYEHRDGVAINRYTGTAQSGAKYDFEIVAKGTQFDFYMIAENLNNTQKKQLDFIIKLLEGKSTIDGDYLSVGGKTTRGMGRVKLINYTKNEITAEELKKNFNF